MKRILFFLALVPTMAFAAVRSANEAAIVAAEFMNQQVLVPARKAATNASSYKLAHTRQKLNSAVPAFYVFNNTNAGFIVVSADDRTEDILLYSEEGTLDLEKANPNLQFWLGRLQEEISAANDENTFTDEEKQARLAIQVEAISPLLVNQDGKAITWYQEAPYYNQCPKDGSSYSFTGCVATAAAQIMYKWRYPVKGTGSHSYTTSTKKIKVSQDFSEVTFDWDNMLPAYFGKSSTTAQKNAVAWLMRCCGVACDMDYTKDGSGAYTDDLGKGITTYLGYKAEKFITTYSKAKYGTANFSPAEYSVSSSKFAEYFNADLEAGRPIIMGGEDSDGGHEFVCDGRDANGKFHINWGWEGDGNCYCLLTSLKPTGTSYNFSSNIDAMIGLEPTKIDTIHVTGITVVPTTLTLKQKERSIVSATIAPLDASDKTYSWFSSNPNIATVSAAGQVLGVAQGEALIIATSNDGGFMDTCVVTVTEDSILVTDCEEYSYYFTIKCGLGTKKLGDYTWEVTCVNSDVYTGFESNRGAQFGSSGSAAEKVSFTSFTPADCLINEVKVTAAIASSGDGQLSVYIDSAQIGSTQDLISSNKEYTFINTASLQGNLEIRLTNSTKAMYIKRIEINNNSSDLPLLNEQSKTIAKKLLLDGQLYIVYNDHLYNAQGNMVK